MTSLQIKNDVDITDLERKLSEVFHELTQKNASLEEVRNQLCTESVTKQNLQMEIDRLNREINDLKVQLQAASKAFHTCEESLSSAKATSIQQKQQLDATFKTNDMLRDQATKVQSENMLLQNKVEELERQLRSNIMIKESCTTKQSKTHTLLETLSTQVRSLEKDRRCFERLTSVAIELGNKNQLLVEHNNAILKLNHVQKENLHKQVITLSAEIDILREQLKQAELDVCKKPNKKADFVEDILQEWKNSLNEIKARSASEVKESEMLQKALKESLEAQVKLQNLEVSACKEIKELKNALQEERELNKKPPSESTYQQTESLKLVDVACGLENKTIQHNQVQTEQLGQCSIEVQTDLLKKVVIDQMDKSSSPIHEITLKSEKFENINLPSKKMLIQKMICLPVDPKSDNLEVETASENLEDISELPTQKLYRDI